MKTLFVCQTPLHFLLATLLLQTEKKEATFVWVEESAIDAEFVKNIVNINNAKLIKLRGAYRSKGKIERASHRLSNIKELKNIVLKHNFNELFIFNDLPPETQFLIHEIDKSGGHIFLGEDGVALYETAGIIKANMLNKLFGKFVYGKWWSSEEKIGINPKIKTIYACKPELVRSEIAHAKTVLCMPKLGDQRIINLFKTILPPTGSTEIFILCILPLLNSSSARELNSYLRHLMTIKVKLAFKFHPREQELNVLGLTQNIPSSNYIIMPKDMPAEFFCMISPPPSMVIGSRSSALHIINSLFSDIQVRYIEVSLNQDSAKWKKFYNEMGVSEFVENHVVSLNTI